MKPLTAVNWFTFWFFVSSTNPPQSSKWEIELAANVIVSLIAAIGCIVGHYFYNKLFPNDTAKN